MEYLLLVLVLAAVGITVVIVRNRRPTSFGASVEAFERAREALAPEDWHRNDASFRPTSAWPQQPDGGQEPPTGQDGGQRAG
jgi:hypothetical protein